MTTLYRHLYSLYIISGKGRYIWRMWFKSTIYSANIFSFRQKKKTKFTTVWLEIKVYFGTITGIQTTSWRISDYDKIRLWLAGIIGWNEMILVERIVDLNSMLIVCSWHLFFYKRFFFSKKKYPLQCQTHLIFLSI